MNGRTLKRKPKLVRSENVCDHSSGLDSIIRESLLQIAWPISASFSAEDSLYVRAQGGNFAIRLIPPPRFTPAPPPRQTPPPKTQKRDFT
ncbi:hypothetical protein Pmani_027549 [Petrolisthes manimaculis]|uniref:Uncharacterized protein n=1 Tax=Petrolisthes manimaculis TaxID=1843537 RepID=A0AAE1P425_9EUCA|nr:hypothetical protein Pmani_027549 [Petrolisthes manimaculis]